MFTLCAGVLFLSCSNVRELCFYVDKFFFKLVLLLSEGLGYLVGRSMGAVGDRHLLVLLLVVVPAYLFTKGPSGMSLMSVFVKMGGDDGYMVNPRLPRNSMGPTPRAPGNNRGKCSRGSMVHKFKRLRISNVN